MEVASTSEKLVSLKKTAWYHIAEDSSLRIQRHEILISLLN
jgi:hypothetical protein